MQYKKSLEKQGLPLSKIYDIRKYLEIYLSDCKKILDIGCGFGEFCQIAKDYGKEVYSIDINEEMVKHYREKNIDVSTIISHISSLFILLSLAKGEIYRHAT